MKKVFVVVLAVLVVGAAVMLRTADLKPTELKNGISPEQAKKGRALLDKLARTHGRAAMEEREVMRLAMADEWFGAMGEASNPFPVPRQEMDVLLGTHEWSGRFVMTNGPSTGTEWGMQGDRIYRRLPDGPFESPPVEDLNPSMPASFIFPTLRYFVMLPIELRTAELVAALEPVEEDGRTFDRVYATWGSVDAHPELDQYIVWIDRATSRLDRVEYTVREMMQSARGLAVYRDYVRKDGAILPKSVRIHVVLPSGIVVGVHDIGIVDWSFADDAAAELRPLSP